jgi:hypothetical protein
MTECDFPQIEESRKWEIYVKYRQIVSQFLTDRARSGNLFVVRSRYVGLAKYFKYLALLLTANMKRASFTSVFPWILPNLSPEN